MRRTWTNYCYLVPIFLFLSVFIYYTIAYTFYTSFYEWNGISKEKDFIGFKNYIHILQDPIFYIALKNTFIYMILTITIQASLGLWIAISLKSKMKLKWIYKITFFLPVVLAPAVIAPTFSHIFEANNGY